jgi:hypothetical protein
MIVFKLYNIINKIIIGRLPDSGHISWPKHVVK